MTGVDLDQRLRKIFAAVTKETAFSSAAAVAELGFPPRAAFAMVAKVLEAKEKGLIP